MKCWIFICCLFLFGGRGITLEVRNLEPPLHGEWSFDPHMEWEAENAGNDMLVDISAIRINKQGNIFVMNSRINRVHVFNFHGKHLFSFAGKGEGPGEIKDPFDLFLVDNQVIIPDMNRIHYFTDKGIYLKSVATPEMFIPYFFLDDHRALGYPFSHLRRESRTLFLYDLKSNQKNEAMEIPAVKPFRYSGNGMRLMLKMPFELNEDLIIVKNSGNIWYGYSDTYKVQRLDFSQKKNGVVFSLDGREREILSSDEKLKILDRFGDRLKEIPRNIVTSIAEQIPNKAPFFHQIFSDSSNLFYVLTAGIAHSHVINVDVFSPQGKYLYRGHIDLEPGSYWSMMEMKENHLVVFLEDREGENKLVSYTLNIPKK
jgi:hypothetical protein